MKWEQTIPVLSTAHMPDTDAVIRLESAPNAAPGAAAATFDGGFVFIEREPGAYPANHWLTPIAQWLRSVYPDDVEWVRFDSDGDLVADLPVYDWPTERPATLVCPHAKEHGGSDDPPTYEIRHDTSVRWDEGRQRWEQTGDVYGTYNCNECGYESSDLNDFRAAATHRYLVTLIEEVTYAIPVTAESKNNALLKAEAVFETTQPADREQYVVPGRRRKSVVTHLLRLTSTK